MNLGAVDLSASLGMELAGKRALIILHKQFNDMLDAIYAEWADIDDQLGFDRTVNEPVETRLREGNPFGNFYYGHRPSLINADNTRFPNVATMVYQSNPKQEELDQEDVFTQTMFVELMAKSDNDEYEVNVRIKRMADAAYKVMMANKTLGGTTVAMGDTPVTTIDGVFAVPDDKGRGTRFLYQGARMEFQFQKYAAVGWAS